jgi:predicted DCC family thiol-disulfide oxidoreductase YuxK
MESNGIPCDSMRTIILVEDGKVFTRSDAALRIARHLSGLWPMLSVFRIVPRPIRDGFYNFVAGHRYRWFGQPVSCLLAMPEHLERFFHKPGDM